MSQLSVGVLPVWQDGHLQLRVPPLIASAAFSAASYVAYPDFLPIDDDMKLFDERWLHGSRDQCLIGANRRFGSSLRS